jgi:DNA-binding NarL/FixJ family response regulator
MMNTELMIQLYGKGYSDYDIAKELNLSSNTIRKWRLKNNLPAHIFNARYRKKLSDIKKREEIGLGHWMRARETQKSWALGWNYPLTKTERIISELLIDNQFGLSVKEIADKLNRRSSVYIGKVVKKMLEDKVLIRNNGHSG